MKNKIIYIAMAVIFSFCFMNYSTAQEKDLSEMVKSSSMPSDEEIMQTIKKYNFDKAKEEHLFKETKKSLMELYSNNNFSPILQGENTVNQNLIEQETLNNSANSQTTIKTEKTKKYASHPALTRRKK